MTTSNIEPQIALHLTIEAALLEAMPETLKENAIAWLEEDLAESGWPIPVRREGCGSDERLTELRESWNRRFEAEITRHAKRFLGER